ncbi:hypothetical protein FRZ44_01120 [Hypericibacter terrae]|uniref:VWFA domain-containing protein n=1 Tax=Hypericibacter terrae TaxID=2602015 RepID=A0A5J6MCX5_9PROT|nr:VWA domain-containing protein [Hypericibacter terrae]QEX14837.1 hypothetical protein FRZ44_01120 [Hypericibacter terrae]
MSRKRLSRIGANSAVAILVGGKPVWKQSDRILTIARQYAAPAAATLLAQPEASADGQSIEWYSANPGTAIRLTELAPAEQAAVGELLRTRIEQLRALAAHPALASQKDLPALLHDATEYPGPDFVYVIGRDPVLTMWGHRSSQLVTPVARPFLWTRLLWPAALAALLLALWFGWQPLSGLITHECPSDGSRVFFWTTCATPPATAVGPDPALLQQLLDEQARAERDRAAFDALIKTYQEKLLACAPASVPAPVVPALPEPAPAPEVVPVPPAPPAVQEAPTVPKVVPPTPPPVPPQRATEAPAPPPAPSQQVAEAPAPAPSTAVSPPPPFEEQKCEEVLPTRKAWEAPQVYFVVDASGSMAEDAGGSTRLDAAKSSIRYMAQHLPGDVVTGLISFTNCDSIVNGGSMSRDALIRATDALQPERGTALARSIERAGNTMSRTRKAIMVVATDGEDTCQGDPCAAAQAAMANNPNLTINVVDVGGSRVAQCIANAGHGRAFRADSADEIVKSMQQAAQETLVPKKCVTEP